MKLLVFGKTGQVATELAALPNVISLGRNDADLSDPAACAAAIRAHGPDAVINAAAYTAVDRAEEDAAQAHVVNADAPGAMAQVCAALGIPMVHISTDYVFAGTGEVPWHPDDRTGPTSVYGQSKRAGECAVQSSGTDFAILRTSWVVSAHGTNFVKTMLRLGAERDRINVVSDQIGGPTGAREIAKACHVIAQALITNPETSGIYHFSGAPDCSWADFARRIFDQAGIACAVHDIPSSDYPTPAERPLNSRMDCSTTVSNFGIKRPHWPDTLGDILQDLGKTS